MKIAILDAATLGADVDLSPIRSLGETAEYPTTSPDEIHGRILDADVVVSIKSNSTLPTFPERRSSLFALPPRGTIILIRNIARSMESPCATSPAIPPITWRS